jgi:quercetin dioxygenase-like cupin family protein
MNMAAKGFVVPPGGGSVVSMAPGRSAALKLLGGETGNSIMLFEETAPAGTHTSFHLHRDSDEVAYVLSGEITFKIGDEVTVGGPGTCAFMPRGVPHAWKNTGAETGRVLFLYTPAGAGGLVLLVHGRNPPPYVLSAEIQAGEEQRGSFATAADQFGMDVRIRARRGFSLGVRTPVIFRAIRHHRAPARPSSSVRSTGARRCRGGLENGGCSGTAPITDGASAASITTRHFVTSSAESCWLLREPVRPTKGIEPPGRRRFVTP